MAATMSSTKRQEEFKEKLLTCSICTKPYDNDQHQAKCLPCLHTYCKSCLQKHVKDSSKFNCQTCRSLVILPGDSVDSLCSNYIVENLKEYHDMLNLAATCGSCEDEDNQAVSFCHDCSCLLCQVCVGQHRRMGPLRGHRLSTVAELQQQKCNPMAQRNQQCKRHPKQELTLFCKEQNCNFAVCASCGLDDHRSHDLIDLDAEIEEIVAGMERSVAQIASKSQEIAKKRTTTESIQQTVTDDFEQKEKDLRESKQMLTNLIDGQYTKAHFHLKGLYQTEMNRLSLNIESLDSVTAQMYIACEYADIASETNNRTQILTSQNHIMDRLSELEIKKVPVTSPDKTLTLTDQHFMSVEKIKEYVQQLFETDWKIRKQQASGAHDNGIPSKSPFVQEKISSVKKQRKQKRPSLMSPSAAASAVTAFAAGFRKISVVPQVDPSQCTISFQQYYSSGYGKATVQTVDTTGKLMTTGGANLEAKQGEGALCKVTHDFEIEDHNDGNYTFIFRHDGGLVYIKINGIPMKGSPFNFDDMSGL